MGHGGSWGHLLGVLDAQLRAALRRAHRAIVEMELGEEGDRAVPAPRLARVRVRVRVKVRVRVRVRVS